MTADYTELLSTNLWEVKLISMSRISFGEMICPSRIILLKTTNKFHLHHHFFHLCALWHKMQTLIWKNERLSDLEYGKKNSALFFMSIDRSQVFQMTLPIHVGQNYVKDTHL